MIRHIDLSAGSIRALIRKNKINYAGNIPARIYGKLGCSSGKRMRRQNRVFFRDQNEAILVGFRPCGKCLRHEYQKWKDLSTRNGK